MTDYPECDKLARVAGERDTIMEFLDWLGTKGYWIGEYRQEYFGGEMLIPITGTTDALTLEHLEIDPVKLENERRAMLKEISE